MSVLKNEKQIEVLALVLFFSDGQGQYWHQGHFRPLAEIKKNERMVITSAPELIMN